MAKDRKNAQDYGRPVRRLLVSVLVLALFAVFVLWRIDSPRVERLRAEVTDSILPRFDWVMAPVTGIAQLAGDFRSYQRIYEQNQELKRELQQMKAWKEAALQLEQENARLLDLNKVRLDPDFTHVTGVVIADSGSPFRQSVLINVGARDGVRDGWATMDGLGLVGRISGVGNTTSRVLLLTDAASRVPVTIQPTGVRALLTGDNSARPRLELIEDTDALRPGDRVFSSGDGRIFPANLLIGEVVAAPDGRLRVRLVADYVRLEFLRVIRSFEAEALSEPGGLIAPASAEVTEGTEGAEETSTAELSE
ncbi:MAG: rod shape-determining protein MreC [Pseudomonadota bacterium]